MWNREPLKILNGIKLIRGIIWTHIQSVWNHSGPVTGQELFVAVSYSKRAIVEQDPIENVSAPHDLFIVSLVKRRGVWKMANRPKKYLGTSAGSGTSVVHSYKTPVASTSSLWTGFKTRFR